MESKNKKIEKLVKQSVRAAVASEFMKVRASVLAYVKSGEQRDIEMHYGKRPTRKGVKTLSFEV